MTPSRIRELRQMLAAATERPWSPHGVRIEGDGQIIAHAELMRRSSFEECNEETVANASLIVSAVNELSGLLDENERLREALTDLLTVLDAADSVKRGDFYHERKAARAALRSQSKVEPND